MRMQNRPERGWIETTAGTLTVALMTLAAACGGSHDGAKPVGTPCAGSCDMTGTWVGRHQSNANDVTGAFVVELVQAGGRLSGSIDLPAVSSEPLAITGKVDGGEIQFGTVGGEITFVGTASENAAVGSYVFGAEGDRGQWNVDRVARGAFQASDCVAPPPGTFGMTYIDGQPWFDPKIVTSDGTFMWSGDSRGLYRYDNGPAAAPTTVYAPSGGFFQVNGLEFVNGQLWVSNGSGILRFQGGVQSAGLDVPIDLPQSMAFDPSLGVVWVLAYPSSAPHFYGLAPDGHARYYYDPPQGWRLDALPSDLAFGDGALWSVNRNTVCMLSAPADAVNVMPGVAGVRLGQTLQLHALVNQVDHPSVSWAVEEGPGCGSVSPDGLYQAPAELPAGDCHVVAADAVGGQSGRATLMLIAAGGVAVAVTPASPTVGVRETAQFTASVTGCTSQAVTWSVSSPMCGSVDQQGLFTPPKDVSSFCRVIATSVADPSASGQASPNIVPVAVQMNPDPINGFIVLQGHTQQVSAVVKGATDQTVTWSLDLDPVATPCGSIDQTGLFTAAADLTVRYPVFCYARAVSKVDPTKYSTIRLEVVDALVSFDSASATVHAGTTQTFTATLTEKPGTTHQALDWSVSPRDCGSVSASGLSAVYTAPASPPKNGTCTLTLTLDGAGGMGMVDITVVP